MLLVGPGRSRRPALTIEYGEVVESSAGHNLVLAFDTDAAEFARGVEVGRVWETLRSQPGEEVCEIMHAANAEMILRMAEAEARPVVAELLDEVWLAATFGPVQC